MKKIIGFIMISLIAICVVGCNSEVKEKETSEKADGAKETSVEVTTEQETSEEIAENITFEFDDVDTCVITNGGDGTTKEISSEQELKNITKEFEGKTWTLKKDLYDRDGTSLLLNFENGVNIKYQIDICTDGIDYKGYLYQSEDFDAEKWQELYDEWTSEVSE